VFRLPRLDEYKTLSGIDDFAAISKLLESDSSDGEKFKRTGDLRPREIVAGLATNKIGLRNVIGNVREWTVDQVAFGNAYYWGQFPAYSPTNAPRPSEQIGLRLVAEPKN
jgi:formylglycine-generating enzyme required for sulfatase activity